MSADILDGIGFGWLVLVAGFFGGWLYLRIRTIQEHVF